MAKASIRLRGEIDFAKLLEQFKRTLGKEVGAIGSFIGIVRGESKKGGEVRELHIESSEQAEEKLKEIASGAEEREGISKAEIHHIIDDLEPGECILCVLVGGKHRKEVFEALPQIMDRVKSEPHIWKKEITENGDYWVSEIQQ